VFNLQCFYPLDIPIQAYSSNMLRLFSIENRPKEAETNNKEMLEFKEKQGQLE